jgi:general stress protein YciG
MESEVEKPKSRKGFASMSPEKRRMIASMGGKSVPTEKRSFSRNRSLASSAGRKGGQTTRPETRTFTVDRELAREAGRIGGSSNGVHKTEAPLNRYFLHIRSGAMHLIVIDEGSTFVLARAQKKIEDALASSGIALAQGWRVEVMNRDGDLLMTIRDKAAIETGSAHAMS